MERRVAVRKQEVGIAGVLPMVPGYLSLVTGLSRLRSPASSMGLRSTME